jgi:uncharacterized Zn finger protein (UPF0148 family)
MAEELCPNCGTPYEPGGTFCINCGAKRVEAEKEEPSEAAAKPPEPKEEPPSEPAAKSRKASKKKAAGEKRPSEEDVLERLEKEAGEEPPPAEPTAPESKPPAAEAKPPEPAPQAPPPLGEEPAAPPPTEPKKKSKKGCCIAIVVAAVLFVVAAVIGVALYYAGVFDDVAVGGGAAFTHDFEAVTEEDFAVWQTGRETLVKPEKGMLKVKNALVGVNYNPGANYTATCVVFVQAVESDSGWAGLSLRVNPKGGDRYSFEILPATKTARIRKIAGGGEPLVLATSRVPALQVGAPFTVAAAVSGSDLTMEVNGTVVGRATDIGLIKGPMGFEVRGATAYFDDLSVETE